MATPPAWAITPNQQQQPPSQPQQYQQQPTMEGPYMTSNQQQNQTYNNYQYQQPDPPITYNTTTTVSINPQQPQPPQPHLPTQYQPTVASIPPKPSNANHTGPGGRGGSTFLSPPPRGAGIVTSTPDEELEDGRVRNSEAVTKIRDAWIYTQISARAQEFTQYRNVSFMK